MCNNSGKKRSESSADVGEKDIARLTRKREQISGQAAFEVRSVDGLRYVWAMD